MSGDVSHLGPFRDCDPAYALALPIEYVAVRSDIDREPSPVFDTMLADRQWAALLASEAASTNPATMTGGRDTCGLCGRPNTALRRDGNFVRHNDPATRTTCPSWRDGVLSRGTLAEQGGATPH